MEGLLGAYISVPFCKAKCSYCNFASGVFRLIGGGIRTGPDGTVRGAGVRGDSVFAGASGGVARGAAEARGYGLLRAAVRRAC